MMQDNYSDCSSVPPDARQESVIIDNYFYSGNECNVILKLEPVDEQFVVFKECNKAVDYLQGSENYGCVSIPDEKEQANENYLGDKCIPLMMLCNSYVDDNVNSEAGFKSCKKTVRISRENECVEVSIMPQIKQECELLENVGDTLNEGVITHNVVFVDSQDIHTDRKIKEEFEGEENELMLTQDYDITVKEEFEREEDGLELNENHEISVQNCIPSVQVFQVIQEGDKLEMEKDGFPLLQNPSETIEGTSCLQKNGDILFVSDNCNASTQPSNPPKADDFNGNYIASILRDQKIVTHEPFECQFCRKQFKVKEHLRVHLLCHPENTPFMCECCGESFQTKKKLAAHRLLHLVTEEYHCPNCGNIICRKEYCFSDQVHCKEKLYQCRICYKVFSLNGNITKHKKVNGETQCCKIYKAKRKFFRPRILRQMPQ